MPESQGFDPTGISAILGSVTGLAQTVGGFIQAGRANKDLKKLFKQRKAYETPAEIFEILQMTQNNAQSGFGAETMDFLTGQADRGLSASLGTAARLGADPNALGGILDSYYQDIFKIGGENELLKMKKFDSLTNALQLVSQNKEAEQISADNLIKDQMAAAAARLGKGEQNISSGAGLLLNSATAFETNSLYNDRTNALNNLNQPVSNQRIGNRGLLDYNYPDLDAGGRPTPRRSGIVN